MDYDPQLANERHTAVMARLQECIQRLEMLNGRLRAVELGEAVLRDRGTRTNMLSWSSLGTVIIASLVWLTKQ